jgi:hypothetical protein
MPKAYHHVFFTVREGLSDAEVIGTLRRYRDVAVMCQHISGHSVPLAFKACS